MRTSLLFTDYKLVKRCSGRITVRATNDAQLSKFAMCFSCRYYAVVRTYQIIGDELLSRFHLSR